MVQETDRVLRALNNFTERLVVRLTLNVTADLQETTPVDTGFARANWIPTIGNPLPDEFGDALTFRPGPTNVASSQAQSQLGLAQVATGYDLSLGNIFVTNNVPYIVNLNEGSSTKAPAGFVQASIASGIRKTIRDIGGIAA